MCSDKRIEVSIWSYGYTDFHMDCYQAQCETHPMVQGIGAIAVAPCTCWNTTSARRRREYQLRWRMKFATLNKLADTKYGAGNQPHKHLGHVHKHLKAAGQVLSVAYKWSTWDLTSPRPWPCTKVIKWYQICCSRSFVFQGNYSQFCMASVLICLP